MTVREAIGYSAFTVLLCLVFAYPGASFIRELIGQRGLAISPLVAAVAVWPVAALLMSIEAWVQAQQWWPKAKSVWAWGLGILLCGTPLITALTVPYPVGEGLPGGVPTAISLSPMILLFVFFVARRRWRERNAT
ncbi:hypothetical protein ACFY12_08890 [Streptomyces sp. NPDC001339]|uniref:hypothetical protein n=1 Tax=Streptomyces sp. NPDC001339 TaxID=3364563 RepID=UPI0036A3E2E5